MKRFCIIGSFIIALFSNVLIANQIIINDSDWPPYFFKGDRNSPPGYAKELLEHCLPETEYTPKFIYYPIKRMRNYMGAGKIDVNIYSYKKYREAFLIYGKEPIYQGSYRFFVRKDASLKINSLNDLKGLRIGHIHGLKYTKDYFDVLEKSGKLGLVRSVNTNMALIDLLLENKIDVFVNTTDTVNWLTRDLNNKDEIQTLDYDIQTPNYFVTVSKTSQNIKNASQFLNTIDMCLKKSKQSGLYTQIKSKYGF